MADAAGSFRRGSMNRPAGSLPAAMGSIPQRVLFIEQNPAAIAAGAFHNDVVAVANERVLFIHELRLCRS